MRMFFLCQQGYQPSPEKDIKLGMLPHPVRLPSEAFIFTRLGSPKRPLLAAERHKMQLDHWNKWKTALQSNVLTYIVVNLHVWNDKYLVEVSLYIVSLSASYTRCLQHILQKLIHLYICTSWIKLIKRTCSLRCISSAHFGYWFTDVSTKHSAATRNRSPLWSDGGGWWDVVIISRLGNWPKPSLFAVCRGLHYPAI